MKVAMVVPGGVHRGGTERVIPALLWLVERLARRHELHVYAMRQEPEPGDWPLLGAHVHNIGSSPGARRRLYARFAVEHRAAPFDVVHAVFASARAAFLAWRHRIPLAVHLAGGEPVALRGIGYGGGCTLRGRAARRAATLGAGRVSVATPYMQGLARAHGVRAEIVPLGVALDRWPPRAPVARDTSRPARLLHVGDLRPVKDQHCLLRAAASLRARGVAFQLDVAGLDTMKGSLQLASAAQGLSGHVRWHGLLSRAALRALVERADLLVMTSRHEAGPLAVLEAAVAGVPTVGTAVGHVAEWAPAAAVAVPVGDAGALARAVEGLLADEPRRMRLAAAAQRLALASDADHTAARFELMYRELAT